MTVGETWGRGCWIGQESNRVVLYPFYPPLREDLTLLRILADLQLPFPIYTRVIRRIEKHFPPRFLDECHGTPSIPKFEDHPGTTVEEVISLLGRAIDSISEPR